MSATSGLADSQISFFVCTDGLMPSESGPVSRQMVEEWIRRGQWEWASAESRSWYEKQMTQHAAAS